MSAKDDRPDDSFTPDGLQQAVGRGTRAVIIAQIVSQLNSFGVLAVLYRSVSEADFGLWGMVVPLVMLVRMLATLPLGIAAVQRSELSNAEASSLFWMNLLLGLIATAAIVGAGPLLALFYDAPELTMVCIAIAATSIVAAGFAQHQAMLERKLQLGRLAVARLLGQTIGGGAGVAAAIGGLGVWSLVIQQYVELMTLGVCIWCFEPWRPNSPRRGQRARDLLQFGGFYSLSSLAFYLAQNLDKVILAFLLRSHPGGRAMVGMYSQAFNLMMKPVYLVTTPITGIMLPALARAAKARAAKDRAVYAEMVGRFYRLVAIVLLPCAAGMFVVAGDLFLVLGGDAWKDAGLILGALSLTIAVQGFINITGSIFSSVGRADLLFFGSVAVALLMIQAYAAGFWLGNMFGEAPLSPALGVAWSYSLVSIVVLFVPYTFFCLRAVRVPVGGVLGQLRAALLAATSMGLVVWGLRHLMVSSDAVPVAGRLAVSITVGVAIYVCLARRELRWLWAQMTDRQQEATPNA